MRSKVHALHKVYRLVVHLMRCGAGDPVIVDALLLAVADYVLLEREAGLPAGALQVPIDRDFVAGDDATPVGAKQDVVDGRTAGLDAGAGQWLAGGGSEHRRDNP